MSILAAPLPVRPGASCRGGCGRELSPGPARHTRHTRNKKGERVSVPPSGKCVACMAADRLIAIPRGRLMIRSGLADVRNSVKPVPAVGRGPNRRALRKVKARARADARLARDTRKVVARAFASLDDKARRREIVARQHVEGKAA